MATYDAGRVLREGVDTVIVGSPNVGKSTLMNWLAGCERSIVTPVAGTTRDVVEETVRLGDVVLRLSDTAGIRETNDAVESIGVQRARQRMEQAALVLAVFDGSRPLSEDDRALAEAARGAAAIAVVSKADEETLVDRDFLAERFPRLVTLSAREGTGLEDLSREVAAVTGVERLDGAEPLLATGTAAAMRAALPGRRAGGAGRPGGRDDPGRRVGERGRSDCSGARADGGAGYRGSGGRGVRPFLRGKVTQKRIRALYINKSGGNTTVFPPLPV